MSGPAEPPPVPGGPVFAPLPRAAVAAFTRTDTSPPRHVIHLPVLVGGLDAALGLARRLARALATWPEVDAAGTTVSEEDTQHVRHWVFCDWIMPDRRRCPLPAGHSGPCAPEDPP
ncbi:hypothetical protein [Micromonospora eburnea]|uniref:hypothetical protein n=1 Tax=Micromonospora eburnea TaxID=227316 RepID=UPI001FC92E39|nr:hypothetical protein [Micromonospora eburnea]